MSGWCWAQICSFKSCQGDCSWVIIIVLAITNLPGSSCIFPLSRSII
jgi:hypothetical protein